MLLVRLITDPLDLQSYEEVQLVTCGLLDFLHERFPSWPETGRLYREQVSVQTDCTPSSEEQVRELADTTNGTFYVVVYPGDPTTAIITAVVTLALAALSLLFLIPRIPKPDNNQSSNNTLGQRANKPRPNGRIPDIFGEVVSIPELLAVPLTVFDNNRELEICYMCVGRGSYNISSVKDGDTPLGLIAGSGAQFYAPFTSPNNGLPFLTIGTAVGQPLRDVVRSNDVNGQILRSRNANSVNGDKNIRFVSPDLIQTNDDDVDFTRYFVAGDLLTVAASSSDDAGTTTIQQVARFTHAGEVEFESFNPTGIFYAGQYVTISNAAYAEGDGLGGVVFVDLSGTYLIQAVSASKLTLSDPEALNPSWDDIDELSDNRTGYHNSSFSVPSATGGYNLDGAYRILAITAKQITLTNPAQVNASWNNLPAVGGATKYISPSLYTTSERWAGPFVIDADGCNEIVANFVALQGMYKVTKKGKQKPNAVTVELELTPVNSNGAPTGPGVVSQITIAGDGTDKDPKGVTLYAQPGISGRWQVRARRVTPEDYDYDGTVVDEVKWRDCYGSSPVTAQHFGDVTTVQTRTLATAGATSNKERKFNCRAARKVYVRNGDGSFGPGLVATNDAAHIFCHMALDPYIGARQLFELDADQIFATVDEVRNYFGFDIATFNYTFDDDNISSEEMLQIVAKAIFCTAYRQASVLRLFFERLTNDSVMLFNHRNKLPASEQRTVRLGMLNDYDGIELDYVSARDGAKLTLYIPEDRTARKPKKLDVLGVVDFRGDAAHPYIHAMRAYNKIRYQNTTTKFSALSEATQLVLTQRIEVADNTRPDVFDGHLVAVEGPVLRLSQPFKPQPGKNYVIAIQQETGVEVLSIGPGADEYHAILQNPPAAAIAVSHEAAAVVTYQITSQGGRPSAFLVAEKGDYDKKTLMLQAINYDERYYQDDLAFYEQGTS